MAISLIRTAPRDERPLAVLDLGTSKISCLIVSASPEAHPLRVGAALPVRCLGFGVIRSKGIRAGTITDLAEAEESVRQAVSQAESQAGLRVDEVAVSTTSGRIQSIGFAANTRLVSATVTSADIDKMLSAAKSYAERGGRCLMHLQRLGFQLDGEHGIRNPRGMKGERLRLDLNAVTADETAIRNLRALLGRAYLSVSAVVAAPYASALATLADENLQGSTVVIDMGAGTTTFAAFREGLFHSAGAVAVGGLQATHEIARALSLPISQAERIKTLYGNLAGAMSDEHEFVPVASADGEVAAEPNVTRAQLRRILAPRVEQAVQLVRQRIAACGLGPQGPDRLVLTGGASQLAGLGDMVERSFGRPVRVALPGPAAGMDPADVTPAASAVLGVAYAMLVPGALAATVAPNAASPAGYVGRLGRWFKDSFWDDEQTAEAGSG